jgi:hypothetical protein
LGFHDLGITGVSVQQFHLVFSFSVLIVSPFLVFGRGLPLLKA